jgi:hypothetical protein
MTEIVKPISRLDQLAGEPDCRHNSRLRYRTMTSGNRRHQRRNHQRTHHPLTEEEEEEAVEEVDGVEVVEEIATRILCDVERLAATASEAR